MCNTLSVDQKIHNAENDHGTRVSVDIDSLYRHCGADGSEYHEIKYRESIVGIRKRWPLIDEVVQFNHTIKKQDKKIKR